MKNNQFVPVLSAFAALLVFAASCDAPTKTEEKTTEAARPDMAEVKLEIQALENEWAKATSAKDVAKVMSFYADDAVVMNDDEPMRIGKEAIQQSLTKATMERKPGTTYSFETLDVFGDGNVVTEVGKTTVNDAAGNVVSTGKYVGVFEKRDGKYLCIRDINNDDAKAK